MKTHKTIWVAGAFSRYPGGRFRTDGPSSGEALREDVLAPALRAHESVTVVLDGAAGYTHPFLEEAFGGLVMSGALDPDEAGEKLKITALEPDLESAAESARAFIERACKHERSGGPAQAERGTSSVSATAQESAGEEPGEGDKNQ